MCYSNDLIECISIALNRIESPYFKLKLAGSNKVIVRERVFCYELYHLIRLQNISSILTLHGEMDKAGHASLKTSLKHKPDFILHEPGNHNNNSIIIEVKGIYNKKPIIDDFLKIQILHKFLY